MYPVSEAYKTAIRARTRTDRVTGTLTLTDGTVLPLTADSGVDVRRLSFWERLFG